MTEIRKGDRPKNGYTISGNIRDLEIITRTHNRNCQCAYCWTVGEQRYILRGIALGVLPKEIRA